MCLLVMGVLCMGNLKVVISGVFSRSERMYSNTAQTIGSAIVTWLFRISVLALAINILHYDGGAFLFVDYAKMLGVVAVVYILQTLIVRLAGWVFISQKQMTIAMEQYYHLRMLACCALYPVLLVGANWPNTIAIKILCACVLLLFSVALIWKGAQLFYTKLASITYILIYFITLEIIPLFAVYTSRLFI